MPSNSADQQQKPIAKYFGVATMSVVIAVFTIVRLVRLHEWIFLTAELVTLGCMVGSLVYFKKMGDKIGLLHSGSADVVRFAPRAAVLLATTYSLATLILYVTLEMRTRSL
jgi:hypothetical protein